MKVRSEMSPGLKWTFRILAPLILGGAILAAVGYPVADELETDVEVLNSAWLRLGIGAFLLGFALWLSSRLSRLQEWVALDGIALEAKSLWRRHVRRESLCNLKAIHPDGCIEFSSGFKVHLEDHRSQEALSLWRHVAWWRENGFLQPR